MSAGPLLAGRYRFGRRVEAARGVLWFALDDDDGSQVVASLVPSRRTVWDPAKAATVRHPHLAPILQLVRDPEPSALPPGVEVGNNAVIVAEHVAGETLLERLKGGPLRPEQAVRFVHDLAAALSALHDAGAVHGAISPLSVIVARGDGGVVPVLTQVLMPALPDYASPERASGRGVSAADDVWALHATLYAALVGDVRSGSGGTLAFERKRIRACAPDDGHLEHLLERGLDPDLEARARSADDLEAELVVWLAQQVHGRAAKSGAPPAPPVEDPAPQRSPLATPTWREPAEATDPFAHTVGAEARVELPALELDTPRRSRAVTPAAPRAAPPKASAQGTQSADDDDIPAILFGAAQTDAGAAPGAPETRDSQDAVPAILLGGSPPARKAQRTSVAPQQPTAAGAAAGTPTPPPKPTAQPVTLPLVAAPYPTSPPAPSSRVGVKVVFGLAVLAGAGAGVWLLGMASQERPRPAPASSAQVASAPLPPSAPSASARSPVSAEPPLPSASAPSTPSARARAGAASRCVEGFFAPKTVRSPQDFSIVCDAVDARTAVKTLSYRLIAGGADAATPGMKEWAKLDWYQLAAYAAMRGACCPGAPPIELPPATHPCDALGPTLDRLADAVAKRKDVELRVLAFDKNVVCLFGQETRPYRYTEHPWSGAQVTFNAFLKRNGR